MISKGVDTYTKMTIITSYLRKKKNNIKIHVIRIAHVIQDAKMSKALIRSVS